MSTFPSVLTSYTNPLATNKLNAPSHSGIEVAQNSGLGQVEAVIGVEGDSSVVGSLQYLIKSPASNGGGHVQSANKGGTGQTQYNKGDILVASSSSVLGKQSAGTDGNAIIYDSTQTNGLNSTPVITAPIVQNQVYIYGQGSIISASVYAVQITPIPSSLVSGQSFDVRWPQTNTSSVLALTVSSLTAARIKNPDGTNPAVGAIQASAIGTIKFDAKSSVFQLLASPDAENLVGTLPAIDGSALINLPSTTKLGTASVVAVSSTIGAATDLIVIATLSGGVSGAQGLSVGNATVNGTFLQNNTISLTAPVKKGNTFNVTITGNGSATAVVIPLGT